MSSGFEKYQRFYARPPAIVVEWHDDQTPARGWLAIDSLRGGAAGGGTRLRPGGNRQEAVFLAKTMGVKFGVAGPAIGGGKSVIDFDPHSAPETKKGVLLRWFRHIAPYLKCCYGTGGDVGIDEVNEATAYIQQVVGNTHPQEGIARGHDAYQADAEGPAPKIHRLKHGVEARVVLPDLPGPRDGAWMIADVSTGWGVARSVHRYFEHRKESLEGKRLIVEGFGAVGAFTAYYLAKLGVKLVATSSRGEGKAVRIASDPRGLDVNTLIREREGTSLPAPGPAHLAVTDAPDASPLFRHEADIFVPAATSHTISLSTVDRLTALGVRVVSCGSNNPFAADQSKSALADWVSDMLAVQRVADARLAIIPDFIANCGMARTFAFLMNKGGSLDASDILADTASCIDQSLDRLLDGHASPAGLLNRGYELFVP